MTPAEYKSLPANLQRDVAADPLGHLGRAGV